MFMRRKWQKALKLSFVSLLAGYSIVGGSPRQAYAARSPHGGMVAILQVDDPVPKNAEKITERYFTGGSHDGDCSYYQLVLNAERSAQSMGADVLKIIARDNHSQQNPCDGIEVAFYRSDDPRKPEQSFKWNAAHPLTWDDFRGPMRREAGDITAAETSCGIAIETNLVTDRGAAKVYVFNTFDKQQSWVRDGYERPEVLKHEQTHWDICEVYTRKMQARFDAVQITGANLQQQVGRIYDEVSNEYLARQEQYEQETEHGTIPGEQQRWSSMIARELNPSSSLSKL
jgi:hypothetical protein